MVKFEKTFDKIWGALVKLSGIILVVLTLELVINIILRIFGTSIIGITDIARYTSLVGAVFAIGENEWRDGNIRVTLLFEHISKRASDIIYAASYVVVGFVMIFVSKSLISQCIRHFVNGDATIELGMPMFIFSGLVAFSFCMLTVCMFAKVILRIYYIAKKIPFDERFHSSETAA